MGEPDTSRDDARALALTAELGAQLRRLNGAGPKVTQFLSMLVLDPAGEEVSPALGALPAGADAVPFDRVRKVVEKDLGARLRDLFDDVEEEPFALASLGQVHRARTVDGDDVALKVQHPGAADAVESDLRNIGVVGPIVKRLAPGLDAGAVLAELRERIAGELDYEIEAQNQRRLARLFRGHPHVRVPSVDTELSTRRVLVTEYVEGTAGDAIGELPEAERDRAGEIAFRFFFGLAWREGIVAGDPHPDNCLLGRDGRLCLLDYGLVRDVDGGLLEGERGVMRTVAEGDAPALRDGLARLGYLHESEDYDDGALLDHLSTAGEWLLAPGERRLEPGYVAEVIDRGYPPRSPWFAQLRRMAVAPQTLLLRRMEVQVLALLGAMRAAGDWGAISAEHHSDAPVASELGEEDAAFFERRR